jgi:dimethylaniline monooxygenase (N-oxide forming)
MLTSVCREHCLGGTFRYRSYDNAELVSSKQLTAFSDHRFAASDPDHVSLPAYVKYLESYAARFNLGPHIRLGTRVKSVEYSQGKRHHEVHLISKEASDRDRSIQETTFPCSHIAMCTGLHVIPAIPAIPGIEHVSGLVIHSSEYKSPSIFDGQDVLILGCGETSSDISYEAVRANSRSVTMCFRTGFLSFPKVLNSFQIFGKTFPGRLPIDGLITNLFESTYVHHSIRKSRLRSRISDAVIKKVMWFMTGTEAGCAQHVGALPNEILGRSYVFLNKSNRAMPYINRPWKKPQPFHESIGNRYLDPPEDAASDKVIDTCTWPEEILSDGRVVFTKNLARKDYRRMKDRVVKPTCVVYCSGYQQDFSMLPGDYPTAAQANVRNIVKSGHEDIAFIGFVRPGVGAIPPIAEMQAMWWTALITGKMKLPTKPGHYKLLTKGRHPRIRYGVDYSTYMEVLAKDFGGAPELWELWCEHGLLVLLVYCFGAAFTPLYRLVGPFKSGVAPGIARTEIFDTIRRRGVTGNLAFGIIPMIFYGWVNLVASLLEMAGLVGQERDDPEVDNVE